jgi:hypothetical protein
MRLRDLQPQPYGKEQPACVNRRVAFERGRIGYLHDILQSGD